MKIYFVRHGESIANRIGEFSNSGSKHPLTEKGMAQAHTLAHTLVQLQGVQIYTSPILRAVQTAEILAHHLNVPIQQVEALREWSVGVYEGTADPEGWELHRQVQEDWFLYSKFDSKMPGGECYLDIQARFVPFIDSLIQEGRSKRLAVILVAHGGLYRAMLPVVLTNVDRTYVERTLFPYTACIAAETGSDGLRCISWNGSRFQMDSDVRKALNTDRTIDIITMGAKSRLPRKTEIWFTNVGGRIIICGTPAAKGGKGPRSRRDWLANLKANPDFTFCLKESLDAALPAKAVIITDPDDRWRLMSAAETQWYRDQVDAVEDLVAGSPIVEVVFED